MFCESVSVSFVGWPGGAMVLGKLPETGRPTNLDDGRARAYCACGEWFGHSYSPLPFHFSLSLSVGVTARYRLKYCLKGPLHPKQLTNQPTVTFVVM